MKKHYIMYLLLISMLCMTFFSCTNAQTHEYNAFVLADSLYEDEAANLNLTAEIARYNHTPDDYKDESIAQTKNVVFDGRQMSTKYMGTYYMGAVVNHPVDGYIEDSMKATYHFNHNTGELIGFSATPYYYGQPDETMSVLTEEQRNARIRELAAEYVSVEDLTHEQEYSYYDESAELFSYTKWYHKVVAGAVASEGILIEVDQYGRLQQMFIYTPGMFDNVDVPEIDFAACEAAVEETMNILYDSESSAFEDLSYERTGDWRIRINLDGDLVLSCSVSAEYKNKETGADCHNVITLEIDL